MPIDICDVIRNCHEIYFHEFPDGIIIGVGMVEWPEMKSITCCIKRPTMGCSHIFMDGSEALVLISHLNHVLRGEADC